MRKPFLALCSTLFLALFSISTVHAEPAADSKTWRILHDFSQPLPRAAALPKKKRNEILNLIFPRRLETRERCVATGLPAKVPGVMRKNVCFPSSTGKSDCQAEVVLPQPEKDLSTGNFLAKLEWLIPGTFSRAGASQEAALVSVDYCSGGGSQKLAILAEGKVVLLQDVVLKAPALTEPYVRSFDYGSGAKAIDLNGDGRDEILTMTDFYATMDVDRSFAALLTSHEGRWEQIATFDNPTTSRCESYYTAPERFFEAKVVKYRPDSSKELAEFETETKELHCP